MMETKALEIVRELLGGPACRHIETICVTTRYRLVDPSQGWESRIAMRAEYVVKLVSAGRQDAQPVMAALDRLDVDWRMKDDGKLVFVEECAI